MTYFSRFRVFVGCMLLSCGGFWAAAESFSADPVFSHPLSADSELAFRAVSKAIASHPIQTGTFTQTKYLSKLNRSLVSSGTYLISRDDGMVWNTQKPFPSVMTVTKTAIMQTTASGKKTVLQVGSNATFESFSAVISSVFAGGDALSAEHFDVFFSGTEAEWTVGLVPKDSVIRAVARYFVLQGGTTLRQVTMQEGNGDSVRYAFDQQRFPAALSDQEKTYFSAP